MSLVTLPLRLGYIVLLACAGCTLVAAVTSQPGWQVTSFANGFTSCKGRSPTSGVGPIGIAFVGSDLFINDHDCFHVWKFPNALSLPRPLDLSLASPYLLNTVTGHSSLTDYATTADGKLYMTTRGSGTVPSGVFEIDTATGLPSRTLALTGGAPLGISADATNPKRLVFTNNADNNGIYEIPDKDAASPVVNKIASLPGFDGIQVANDGTIWATEFNNGNIRRLANDGTYLPPSFPSGCVLPDGIAVAADSSYIVVNCAGGGLGRQIFLNGTSKSVWTGGTRGDFATVGPDGCMYATQSVDVLRIALEDGSCPFSPVPGSEPQNVQNDCNTCTNTETAPTVAPASYEASSNGLAAKLCFTS